MRAVSRLDYLLLAGAVALVPAPALAQEAPTTNQPATDSVGPSDLQNFSINGTVTKPADKPATTQPAPQQQNAAPAQTAPGPSADQPAAPPASTAQTPAARAPAARAARIAASQLPPAQSPQQPDPQPIRQSPAASSVTATLPALNDAGVARAAAQPPSSDFAPAPASLAAQHGFSVLPWILAALVLAAGAALLFWRRRMRPSYAGGPQVDLFSAPEPIPAPRPAPAPPRAAPVPRPAPAPQPRTPEPAPATGVVSTRIRPWIEIGFNPIRCILNETALVVEFELELFNSGSALARAVRVDAAIFNAGPEQDQQIGEFIANPVGEGEAIEIPPLKRIGIKTQVSIARDQVLAYELAGRQVFLPVIAFNTLYGFNNTRGQTSTAYLLGRDTKAEKMAPFRIDLGPRIFRGVAARLLPTGVRQ